MGKTEGDCWVCPRCRTKKTKNNTGDASVRGQVSDADVSIKMKAISAEQDVLQPLKEKVDSLMLLSVKIDELLSIKDVV